MQEQAIDHSDVSTLPTKELQALVHEPFDSCKRQPNTISLVIPDLMMLKMDGQDALRKFSRLIPRPRSQ
jgi:CheY-like chemotaxis protein